MNWDLLDKVSVENGRLGIDTILLLLIMAAAILGLFYVVKKYIVPFLNSRRAVNRAKIIVLRLEVTTWIVFALFALTRLFSDSFWITTGLLVAVAWAGLNFWKDFFPGLRFRLENKFAVNDQVRFDTYSGVIRKLGKTAIEIQTEEEELLFLPYGKLSSGTFVKRQAKGKLVSAKLVFNIGERSEVEVVEQLNNLIYRCPWVIPESKNSVSVQQGGTVVATIYAVDGQSLVKAEEFLKKQFS